MILVMQLKWYDKKTHQFVIVAFLYIYIYIYIYIPPNKYQTRAAF